MLESSTILFFPITENTCLFISNLVLNGGNKFIDLEHFEQVRKEFFGQKDLKIEHMELDGLIAVQGPTAAAVLQKLFKTDLSKIGFMEFFKEKVEHGINCELTVYRTGYTGEDGFEISIPNKGVTEFAQYLFAQKDVYPAGLGSRDGLRLEAGLCLHGHDISQDISPVESLLQWTIRKKNAFSPFIGAEALTKIKSVFLKESSQSQTTWNQTP